MKVQNLCYQPSYNKNSAANSPQAVPVSFAGKDKFVRKVVGEAAEEFVGKVKIRIPSKVEQALGHDFFNGNHNLRAGFNKWHKMTVGRDCLVDSKKIISSELNVGRDLTLSESSMIHEIGNVNVGRDVEAFGADIFGDMNVGRNFRADAKTVVGSNVSAGKIDFVGTALGNATLSGRNVNIYGKARMMGDSQSIGKETTLSGEMLDESRLVSEIVNLGWGRTSKDARIFCKEIRYYNQKAKFDPASIENLEGKIYTEKCSEDLLSRYPEIFVIKKPGWFEKFVKANNFQIPE